MVSLLKETKQRKSHPFDNLRRKYLCINPVIALKNLQSGDVIFSKSGNVRLVIFISKEYKKRELILLSFLNKNVVKLEYSILNKIDVNKLELVIRRKDVKPLENFLECGKVLNKKSSVIKNVRVLLQAGDVGEEFKQVIDRERANAETIKLIFNCSKRTGEIISIGTKFPNKKTLKFTLEISTRQNPYLEYIKKLKLFPGSNAKLKKEILLACIYATCIQNACRLYEIIGGNQEI